MAVKGGDWVVCTCILHGQNAFIVLDNLPMTFAEKINEIVWFFLLCCILCLIKFTELVRFFVQLYPMFD